MPWFAIGARLELARAYLALGDPAGARAVITEAEAIAHRRRGLGVLYTSLPEMRRQPSKASSALCGASTLTGSEVRLLPILSTSLTFKEIGSRLFPSQHAVKTQAILIYGKLGASSRGEAVEHAIDLELLEPFPGMAVCRPSGE
jgi:LuxR family transcriptional regulator, maltose regulon positive regulatory protein